jgi:hypothetical protein
MTKSMYILISLLFIGIFLVAGTEFVLASGTCQSMKTIGCGSVDSASTQGLVNKITTYKCALWDESGPEYVYSFVPQGNGQVTATLSNITADLDVFVLEGTCGQNSCIAYGDTSAIFNVETGTQYYIVVDGYVGASSNFTLSVVCGWICEPMDTIGCGDVDSSSTEGMLNKITTYNCTLWDESGPEYVYSFVPQGNGQVTATLSNMTADLDVFVLQGTCGQNSCIAYGDSFATFNAMSGTQYYIVVDGYAGASGIYTLEVTCSGGMCEVKLAGDVNGDCYVNFTDLAIMANNWLKCNNTMDPECTGN